MKRISRWIALCAGVVVLAVIVFSSVRRVRGAGQEQAESAGKEQSQPEKKPVTDKSGDPIVYLKQESLAMSGVRTALLARTSGQSESQVAPRCPNPVGPFMALLTHVGATKHCAAALTAQLKPAPRRLGS